MARINLRDFYTWYKNDEFVEVSDEIAAELLADKRYHRAQERSNRRNQVHSLDSDNGLEIEAGLRSADSPEAAYEMMEQLCRLCYALNSLPEIQGRRIEAHFLHGKTQAEIAENEGVSKGSVSISITRGLAAMKIFYENFKF